jgi:hypothetical protein
MAHSCPENGTAALSPPKLVLLPVREVYQPNRRSLPLYVYFCDCCSQLRSTRTPDRLITGR